MVNRQNNNNQELNGFFIYHDPKKGCVYYDVITKNGYVLSKSDYQSFSKFSFLKLLCVVSIYLLVELLGIELWESALIGIGLFIAIEIIFRKTFIYQMPKIEKYKPIKKDRLYESMAKNMSVVRLIITTIIALITAVLIVIYAEIEKFVGFNRIVSYAMALVIFTMFVNGIIAIIYKNKENKQK